MTSKLAAAVITLALILAPVVGSGAIAAAESTPSVAGDSSATDSNTTDAGSTGADTTQSSTADAAAPVDDPSPTSSPTAEPSPEPTPRSEPSSTPKPDPTPTPEPTSKPDRDDDRSSHTTEPRTDAAADDAGSTTNDADADPAASDPAASDPETSIPAASAQLFSRSAVSIAQRRAASDPEQFAFTPGFDGSYVYTSELEISGTADPTSESIYGMTDLGECYSPVDPLTGAWSCTVDTSDTARNVDITMQSFDGSVYVDLGSATVHVLLPPVVDSLDGDTIYAYTPYPTISGYAEPSIAGQASIVVVSIQTDDGQVSCTATVDLEGGFACTQSTFITPGTYELSVEQQPYWSEGNRSYPANDPETAFIRVVGPEILIDGAGTNSYIFRFDQGEAVKVTGRIQGELPEGDVRSMTAAMALPGHTPITLECSFAYPTFSCDLPVAPTRSGLYELTVALISDSETIAINNDISLTVTGPPTFTGAARTVEVEKTLRLTGIKITGQYVVVEVRRGETVVATFDECTSVDGGDVSTWACSYPLAGTGITAGEYQLAAWQSYPNDEGHSPEALANLTVTKAAVAPVPPATDPDPEPTPTESPSSSPTSTPTPTPTPTDASFDWSVSLGGSDGPLHPGDTFTIDSTGLPVGTYVDAELHSTPVALGSTTVGSDGAFSLSATVPLDIEPGAHEVVVTVTPPTGAVQVSRTPVTIEAAAVPTATPTPTPAPTSIPVLTVPGTSNVAIGPPVAAVVPNERNEKGAPNGLSRSILPFWEVISSPVAIGSSIIAGLVFLVLVAFPSELLTAAIKDRYKFMQRRAAQTPAPGWWTRLVEWFTVRPLRSGIALMAFATLIAGFADPDFGFDLASLRMLIACFVAAIVVSYGTYVVVNQVMNRRWALPTTISLRPFTIIITIVGIILSRVLDFSPGFLFGLMLGLSFPPQTTPALRSRARLIRTMLTLGIAFVAWIGYSIAIAVGPDSLDFGTALVQDTLAALSTEGLTGILIAMLPFLYLDGQDIWSHSKRLWAAVYVIVTFSFFIIVAPKPDSWADLGDKYGPWALALGIFTAIALTMYFGLRISERQVRKREAAAGERTRKTERELQL